MQLEWVNHSSQLLDGVSELLNSEDLLDVTITAEGKKIRAHRVILSAASSYFKVSYIVSMCYVFRPAFGCCLTQKAGRKNFLAVINLFC